MPVTHGLRFDETSFWVTHRRREFGPFDYQWSPDMAGIALTYKGVTYGEVCSMTSFHADLKEFGLPIRVAQVASLTAGCLIFGLLNGAPEAERHAAVERMLRIYGWGRFVNQE